MTTKTKTNAARREFEKRVGKEGFRTAHDLVQGLREERRVAKLRLDTVPLSEPHRRKNGQKGIDSLDESIKRWESNVSDLTTVLVGVGVSISHDCHIYKRHVVLETYSSIMGRTYVEDDLILGQGSTLKNSMISAPAIIRRGSVVSNAYFSGRNRGCHKVGRCVEVTGVRSPEYPAVIKSNADVLVIGNAPVSGRSTCLIRTTKGWRVNVGCFEGTLEEFAKQVRETHGPEAQQSNGKVYQHAERYAWYQGVIKLLRHHVKSNP